ncbi:Proteinase, regulatory CLIP domain [Cinara cedri]|uniref:Proteinase, regulatory CLIP domain n=1 Tax=Cinara cedri TaxID=506608 RepID=A0A5E4MYE1_9HEMI|nr:Proteinase, regulatory CLIP domain [Cinara cedri]
MAMKRCPCTVVKMYSCSRMHKHCQTPSNLDGVCLDMNLCPPLQLLSEVKNKNESVTSFLRNSICGYGFQQYKVCCPSAGGTFSVTNSKSKPEVPIPTKDKPVLSSDSSPPKSVSVETNVFIRSSEDSDPLACLNLLTNCPNVCPNCQDDFQEVVHLGDLDLDPSVEDEATPIDYEVLRNVTSSALLQVQVPVRDNEDCKQLYSQQLNIVDERVLCLNY